VKQSKDCLFESIFVERYFRVPALKVTHDEDTNEVSVDVCDDPYQYGVLDVSNLPVLISVGQVTDENKRQRNFLKINHFRSAEFILLIQR
jgi:hypothetical protein